MRESSQISYVSGLSAATAFLGSLAVQMTGTESLEALGISPPLAMAAIWTLFAVLLFLTVGAHRRLLSPSRDPDISAQDAFDAASSFYSEIVWEAPDAEVIERSILQLARSGKIVIWGAEIPDRDIFKFFHGDIITTAPIAPEYWARARIEFSDGKSEPINQADRGRLPVYETLKTNHQHLMSMLWVT